MPVQHAVQLGAQDALMQLASEAVRVAAQSPFLERAVGRATAVLCCVYLPDAGLPVPGINPRNVHPGMDHAHRRACDIMSFDYTRSICHAFYNSFIVGTDLSQLVAS